MGASEIKGTLLGWVLKGNPGGIYWGSLLFVNPHMYMHSDLQWIALVVPEAPALSDFGLVGYGNDASLVLYTWTRTGVCTLLDITEMATLNRKP